MAEKETSVTMQEMDNAADEAFNELKVKLGSDKELARATDTLKIWWKKWYMKAGHKRLGRIIANRL